MLSFKRPKEVWNTIHRILHLDPQAIKADSETLNMNFSTTAQRLLNYTPKSEEMLNELIENLPCNQNAFSISKTSFAEIRKAICGLRNDCSTGPDKIPAKYLKLCHIINESIECKIFPSQWKLSKISPIPKISNPIKPRTTSCQSFRRSTKSLFYAAGTSS